MSVQVICCYLQKFKGRENVHKCNGQPGTLYQADTVAAVQNVTDPEKQIILNEIMTLLPPNIEIHTFSLHTILVHDQFSKVCVRWVLCLFPYTYKQHRFTADNLYFQFLKMK